MIKLDVLKINGIVVPGKIVSYKGQMIDVDGDGAGTTEDGYTIRDVRRRNKSKIMVKFDGLPLEDFSAIMEALNSTSFEVTFFCGSYRTITAYAGDKNWEMIHGYNEEVSLWKLDVNIIEY